ncbi:MAG: rRNA pseudouridine synthase [Clostridia bacterium]|nr:rRNA pseudouridine synthase [Clostridia bacterium]
MRLQKYLALCGVASRRNAEKMIAEGQVMVNGKTIREMGTQVEDGDEVRVRGEVVRPEAEKHYLMYHKPVGEVTTASDPEGRPTVLDKFKDYPARLYPVGRLDFDSEGLILLTNDGDLCQAMLHPSREVDKVYLAKVSNQLSLDSVRKLREGVIIDGHMTAPAKVRIIRQETFATVVLVSIHEGRNRQVRKMFQAVGHQVVLLRRVQFGPLQLGDLGRGQWRYLSAEELRKLKELCGR